MIPILHIYLLGDFLLVLGDTPVTRVTVPRLQSLLAYLVLHRSAPLNRSHLAFLMWPDSTEAQAHTNLRKLLYQLRQAFPDIDHFLQSNNRSLRWLPANADASWTLDVLDVEQALAQAELAEQAQDTTALRQAFEQVMSLYRGDLLSSCYDEWILPERDLWREVFLQTAQRLITLLEQERDYDGAITAAQRILRQDPLHEATYRQLMRLHALRGDRATALRVYHTGVTVLERELGTEPSEVTRAVYEALLQSDTSSKTPSGPLTTRRTEAPLLGRKAEWRQLQEAWRKATGGHPHVVILSGEAGIGKTRLAEEMAAWVSRQGMTTASAHCYAAEGRLAYAPVTAWLHEAVVQTGLPALADVWLTEVARLAPEVLVKQPKLPRPIPMTEGWQRQHFFEALAHAVLRAGTGHGPSGQPLLLLLDDLQWCDDETLEWMHYLFRFEPGTRLLLIGTVRTEEILPGHPLVTFLGALQREGLVTEIALGPLTTTETTSLAEHIMGHQLDPEMSNALYHETEGNPLFVVEMARAGTLGQRERAEPDAGSPLPLLVNPASTLPPTVQSVLATRLAQLSPQAHEVANVAAVIGREVTFSVLARASGESEDTVARGLDELWRRRIVREQGAAAAESYDFSHDKLRELAYASLSPAYQHLLHRRIAEAFEGVYAGDLNVVSGQIAAHYERAGLPERAIPYYRRAGETALKVYANADAITAFQRATALLGGGTLRRAQREQHWEEAVAIYVALGDIFAMTGRQQEARQAYQDGMASIPPRASLPIPTDKAMISQSDQKYIWQARLLRKSASTWNLASDNPLDTFHINAQQTFREAGRVLEQAVIKSSTDWLQEWINLQIDQLLPLRGSLDEMTVIIEKAQAIVEQYGTAEQRGQFFHAVVARDGERDRYVVTEESVAYCRKALAEVQQTGNTSLIGFAHFVLGNRLLWSGHLNEAEEEMRSAINIAEQVGNTRLLARCLMFLPFISRHRGLVEDVREVVTHALAVPEARNIAIIKGHRAWLAWRDGSLVEAETYGRASLEERQGQRRVNPFQWAGLWPLIGVMLVQEKTEEAMNYGRMLLDPTQQPPPAQLSALLEAALQAWDTGQQEETRAFLQQAVPPAEKMGYL